jgi:hypothetical protein
MNRNERALLAWSHRSLALLRKSPSRPVRRGAEHPFPIKSSDAYTAAKTKRTFSKFADIPALHFETQSCFTSLAEEQCFVYTIQLWRIAN